MSSFSQVSRRAALSAGSPTPVSRSSGHLASCDWYVNPGNYPWWDNLYIRLMLPLYCRRASGVLAISRATLDQFVKHTRMKLPRAAITHAGTAPNFTAAADPEVQKRFRDE